jgi:hypothetical protein
MLIGTFNGDLGEQVEGDVEFRGTEVLDLSVGAGFLAPEIVCGEGKDRKSFLAVPPVEGFESGILLCVTTE